MCGIAGYIGKNNAEKNLIDSLKYLEYRGYDSAGIAILKDKIDIKKSAGKISNLEKIINYNNNSTCGIAHTRWATHGSANNVNAHPHLSNNKKWAIVHNGIIENFNQIKQDLKKQGYKFKSQTDTEVICNLLEQTNKSDPMQNVISTCNKLSGSYALCCLFANKKDTLFLAKNKSPLFVACNKNEVFVSSDIATFANKVDTYYSLNDNEFCCAKVNNLCFFNKNGKKISKKPNFLTNISINNTKQNHPHFMIKEILQVPNVLKDIANLYKNNQILNKFNKEFFKKFNNIILVGCGTAYHASLMGAKYIEHFARVKASANIASEYRYNNPLIDKKTLCILVSQSGETADTLAVCNMAKENKATTIALTNVLYSTLAQICDYVLPVCAGSEIAVASTKAYTAQISILYMLARHMQNQLTNSNINYLDDILSIAQESILPQPQEFEQLLNLLVKNGKKAPHTFFIGKNFDYITALEASLKLKEITYIFSVEHPAGELKHGFLALIDNSAVLFAIATNKALLEKTLNSAYEAQSRGAKIIFVTQFNLPAEVTKKFFLTVKLPNFKEELMPITSISYFQMLAYLTSVKRGINPDQPRNLAKSVTVE